MSSRGTEPVELNADEAFSLLPAVLDALTSAPWWQCSSEQLAERIQVLARAENRVASAQVAAVGEGVSRGLHTLSGSKTGAAWLRGLVPVAPHVAFQRGGLAVELPAEAMAPVREAFAAGALSVGHAAVVTRTLGALDRVWSIDSATWSDAQALLVAESERVDPAQLGRAGTHLVRRLDPQGPDRLARHEDQQQEQRYACLRQETTGMWSLNALLPPVDGATLSAALDPLGAPRPASDGTPDRRSRQQRMADAVTGLAQLSLAQRGGDSRMLPNRHGSPVRLVVTGDKDTLLADLIRLHGQAGVAPARVEIGEPGGYDVSPLTFQVLACDAEIVPVLLDGFGRTLDVGESVYRFPPRIRKAIELRDAHCTFGACTAPAPWCHAHHLVAFGRNGKPGGPTSEANGTLLCGSHHRFVHANGWTGALIEGRVHWRPPRPGAPPGERQGQDYVNAANRQFETRLRQLALRWLSRNPGLRRPAFRDSG
jgi:Domain of unknown function (DUF222)